VVGLAVSQTGQGRARRGFGPTDRSSREVTAEYDEVLVEYDEKRHIRDDG
jgi:hypothetical protein